MNPILMTTDDLALNPLLTGATAEDQILAQIEPVSQDVLPMEEAVPMPSKPPLDNAMLPPPMDLMGGDLPMQDVPIQQMPVQQPPQQPRGFLQQIGDYARANAGDLITRGINQINENYMTDNMSVDNYLRYLNTKNEKEIANKKNILDNLALEQEAKYRQMEIEVKREDLALQRQMLFSQMQSQNLQNMVLQNQLQSQGMGQQAALQLGATPQEIAALGVEGASKVAMEREGAESEKQSGLDLVRKMQEYNEGTIDAPYAGLLQPITRIRDPQAATNMALLQQTRLRIAAPLAKQLGVNPTDKDFENTLNQIFNENESKATRAAQLRNLETIMRGDVDVNGVDEFRDFVTGGSMSIVPQGVTPDDLQFMTPEERALFE